MRKKIVRRVGRVLLQSSIYITLAGTLSIPASGWAEGWSTTWGKIKFTESWEGGFFVYMDPAATNNTNSCTNYGTSTTRFHMVYPASGAPSDAQKVILSQVSLAIATGKTIMIYSKTCTISNFNSIDNIILNAD
ncbi:hypothetical protein [Methylomonas sp. CM2]|uniref:hypothetical protein n=1 Tax=Methylomonas sp. CM2 TaxID=3417647 RepID=UPI003CF48273